MSNTQAVEKAKRRQEAAKMQSLYKQALDVQRSDPEKSVKLCRKSLKIADTIADHEYQYNNQYNIGIGLNHMSELEDALEAFIRTLQITNDHFPNSKQKNAVVLLKIGQTYMSLGVLDIALDYIYRAMKFKHDDLKQEINNSLGALYGLRGDNENALKYFNKSLEHARQQKDSRRIYNYLLNIARIHYRTDELNKSKKILETILNIPGNGETDLRPTVIQAISLDLRSNIAHAENDYESALKYADEAMAICEQNKLHREYCYVVGNKSKIHLNLGDEQEGIKWLESALEVAEKHHIKQVTRLLFQSGYEYYKEKDDVRQAMNYLERLNDFLVNDNSKRNDKRFERIITRREEEIRLLEEKNRKIEAHNAMLEQFAFVLSHDLREPVRNIVSFASLVDNKYAKALDDEGRDFLNFIKSRAINLKTKWDRLLKVATIKEVKRNASIKTKLSGVIDMIAKQFRQVLNGNQLHIDYEEMMLPITKKHLQSIFYELIDNAVHYRKSGEDCWVDITCRKEKDTYHFAVTDKGIGIKEKQVEKVIRIFQKLDRNDHKGVGAGLAICQRIVQLYDGKIWMESEPGKFTTVYFTLVL